MKPDHRETLLDRDITSFVLKGLRSPSIREAPVAVVINGEAAGNYQALEVFERVLESSSYPQTIADIVSNMYFRLTYQKADGTSGTFGTSIVGSASFRTFEHTLHFIPSVTGAEVDVGEPHRLRISISGVYGDMASVSSRRTYATKAEIDQTVMKLEVVLTALKDIHLSQSYLGNDAFRLFSISSMYLNPRCYDGNIIKYKSGTETRSVDLRSIKKRGRYIFERAQAAAELELVKELRSSDAFNVPGSIDSPSIRARILSASIPIEELGIQAYLANSMSANDDSLSIWAEWTACPGVLRQGQTISVEIEFSAIPPQRERSILDVLSLRRFFK